MKNKLDNIKLFYGLTLLLLGVVQGVVFFFTRDGLAQNHYSYITSIAEDVVLAPSYLPVFAAACLLCGTWLLVSIRN